jgi:hypothetical protein
MKFEELYYRVLVMKNEDVNFSGDAVLKIML